MNVSDKKRQAITHTCDVLVIGGGIAGMEAALRAVELGKTAILVDKGVFGHSGSSGMNWGHTYQSMEFSDDSDQTIANTIAVMDMVCEGLLNQPYFYHLLKAHKDEKIIQKALQYGSIPLYNEDGTVLSRNTVNPNFPVTHDQGFWPRMMAQWCQQNGNVTEIIDQMYIVDILLAEDGRAAGAVGINLVDGIPHIFRSKATIMAAGSYCWITGWNGMGAESMAGRESTGDGIAMLLRHGIPMADMEQFCGDASQWTPFGVRQTMGNFNFDASQTPRDMIYDKDMIPWSEMLGESHPLVNMGASMRIFYGLRLNGRTTENGGCYINKDCAPVAPRYFRRVEERQKAVLEYDLPQYVEVVPETWDSAGCPRDLTPYSETVIPGMFFAGAGPGGVGGMTQIAAQSGGWLSACGAAALADEIDLPAVDAGQISRILDNAYDFMERKPEDPIRASALMHKIQRTYWDREMGPLKDEKKIKEIMRELDKSIGYGFLPGCSLSSYNPEAVQKTVAYLKAALPKFSAILRCCGKPTRDMGQQKLFEKRFAETRADMDALGIDKMILACPNCKKVFDGSAQGRSLSLWEIIPLIGLPEEIKGKARHSDMVFTIHDSCSARNDTAAQDGVRWILEELGYQYVEPEYARENTRCDTPAGKYQYYGTVHYPNGKAYGTRIRDLTSFDPAVLVDDDGKVWFYSGNSVTDPTLCKIGRIMHNTKMRALGGKVLELEADMLTVKSAKNCIPGPENSSGTGFEGNEFFEASSIRKFDGRYYFVYSTINSHDLCYAVSDKPDGPFQYGGRLLSNGNIGYKGGQTASFYWGNNHGSLVKIGEKYYVFGHRQTNANEYSRQGIAQEIIFRDEKFEQAEMTSCGLNGGPLKDRGIYNAGIACILTGPEGACKVTSIKDKSLHPYITQSGEDREGDPDQFITNIRHGTTIEYKYFHFSSANTLTLWTRGAGHGTILVRTTEGPDLLGAVEIEASAAS